MSAPTTTGAAEPIGHITPDDLQRLRPGNGQTDCVKLWAPGWEAGDASVPVYLAALASPAQPAPVLTLEQVDAFRRTPGSFVLMAQAIYAAGWDAHAASGYPGALPDVEAMLAACIPDGHWCDPRRVADDIRAYFAARKGS